MDIFLLIGFMFLSYRMFAVAWNVLWNPRLPNRNQSDICRHVSVLVPARNEAETLPHFFSQLVHLHDEVSEIIILDDNSSDETRSLLDAWATTSSKHTFLEAQALPVGWLGKNQACHRLATAAKGDYLLFLDADVGYIHPHLLKSALYQMEKRDLTLLSIFPDQDMYTFGEKVIVPLMHLLLLSMLPLTWIFGLPFPSMAAANGQCMLFHGDRYRQHRWHEQVKGIVIEDIAIMQKVKHFRLTGATCTGNRLISTRMYRSWEAGISGFGKNILAGFGGNIWGLALFLIFVILWPIAVWGATILGTIPPAYALVPFLGILWIRSGVSYLARQPLWQNLLFHPLQMYAMVRVSARALRNHFTQNNIWKGRNVHI